ncbi:unnamed protein product [Auanema sp. JU1783]|nr:unnamed protein product [Auanema sp. JU1783]
MPLKLIRKLSFRHKKSADRDDLKITAACSNGTMHKSSSSKGLFQRGSTSSVDTNNSTSSFPEEVLLKIVDSADIFEQIRLRAVCKTIKNHVDNKLKPYTHLDVQKADVRQMTSSSDGWVLGENSQVAIKLKEKKVRIVVDRKWTARDIQAIVGLMSVFRKSVIEATIDAPIAELLVVSISALDLNRWYAFQCFMKAMDAMDEDMHLQCEFTNPGEVYWPKVQHLTIRTTEREAPHLDRVIDYGVKCNFVLERRNLHRLRIVFVDIEMTTKTVSKHLYNFRCWAGSAGFDHRFEQQFGVLI